MRPINKASKFDLRLLHRSMNIFIILLFGFLAACGTTETTSVNNSTPLAVDPTNTVAPSIAEPTNTSAPPSPEPTITNSPTPEPIPTECDPVGGTTQPLLCIVSVDVQVNDESPQPVRNEVSLTLQTGDSLRLVNLIYCASQTNPADKVASEAYLFKDKVESYDNGTAIGNGPTISKGCGVVGDFEGSWSVETGSHRISVALVHYFGDNFEVADRFFINLDVTE